MKNALFQAIKISGFGKWVEHHNGDHMIHVTSDDVRGDRKVAQPSHVHATEASHWQHGDVRRDEYKRKH